MLDSHPSPRHLYFSDKGREEKCSLLLAASVVVGVSKVCQVSQLYPAIDDLAASELGSMMPSLFTLQASLVFFSSGATVLFSLC